MITPRSQSSVANRPTRADRLRATIVDARRRQSREYTSALSEGLGNNREAVAEFAAGGGGTAAHVSGSTTRGHIWLLPPDSPLRRPWRANMVARPATTSSSTSEPISLSMPLTTSQLHELRRTCAVTSAYALPSEECAICYSELALPIGRSVLEPEACIVRLPCGHFYHFRCLQPWLRKGRLCPTCRRTVSVSVRLPMSPRRDKPRP